MKKIIARGVLFAVVAALFPFCAFAAAKDQAAQVRLERLIEAKAVPDYVAQQGLFEWDPNAEAIVMTSDGVSLRSQPNGKAHSLGKLNRYYPGILSYSGTWTHPKDGSRWYIGTYRPKHPDQAGAKVGWVSAKYAKAVNGDEFKAYQAQQLKAQQEREKTAAAKKQQTKKTPAKAQKVDNRVFQCVKCGLYWNMAGTLERMNRAANDAYAQALGPMASLFGFTTGNQPPRRQCKFGGYCVWQRIQ